METENLSNIIKEQNDRKIELSYEYDMKRMEMNDLKDLEIEYKNRLDEKLNNSNLQMKKELKEMEQKKNYIENERIKQAQVLEELRKDIEKEKETLNSLRAQNNEESKKLKDTQNESTKGHKELDVEYYQMKLAELTSKLEYDQMQNTNEKQYEINQAD